jgi:alpha-galactosidase
MIDRSGVRPTRYGALPPQMAALCDWNMRMFDLGAQAAIERSKEKAIHALMLDPLTAAVCSPAEIKRMTLELFAAEKDFLPGYK